MLTITYTDGRDGQGGPQRSLTYSEFSTLQEYLVDQQQQRCDGEDRGFSEEELWFKYTKEELLDFYAPDPVPEAALRLAEQHGAVVQCLDSPTPEPIWYAPDEAPSQEGWLWHCIQVANQWHDVEIIEQPQEPQQHSNPGRRVKRSDADYQIH